MNALTMDNGEVNMTAPCTGRSFSQPSVCARTKMIYAQPKIGAIWKTLIAFEADEEQRKMYSRPLNRDSIVYLL